MADFSKVGSWFFNYALTFVHALVILPDYLMQYECLLFMALFLRDNHICDVLNVGSVELALAEASDHFWLIFPYIKD
jgi:hypothetical protein